MSGTSALAGRSVFVTGAYGLLGSWLVKALLERGARTTVLRRDAVAVSALALEGTEARVNVVHGDICDAAVIERALGEYEVDSVFHLAAQTIVGVANRSPVSTFEANIRGTWTVLEACRRSGVGRVVVAASDKAYGAHDELPYREELALQPIYPYDVSKAATDMIARSYWHTFELPVAVTRLANIYGGGDLNLSRLVPECVLAAIAGRAPVIRSDGTLERDYLYVEDAVDAYLAIWELLEDGRGAGEAFNAGETGRIRCSRWPTSSAGSPAPASSRTSAEPAPCPARSTASGSTRRSCGRCRAGSRGSRSRRGWRGPWTGTGDTCRSWGSSTRQPVAVAYPAAPMRASVVIATSNRGPESSGPARCPAAPDVRRFRGDRREGPEHRRHRPGAR